MELVFRKLHSRAPWDRERSQEETWLLQDDIRADALNSLKTQDNTLSVYVIDSKEKVDRVIGALAAHSENIQKLDYAIFDSSILDEVGISLCDETAPIPDSEVALWHKNLINLSGEKLLKLALAINQKATIQRKLDQPVGKLINEMIQKGYVDPTKLNENLRLSLKKQKYQPS